MHLLKKKCGTIFKSAFIQWRSAYHLSKYAREAIEEFSRFRENRLKRVTFGALAAIISQEKQIKDMTRRAKGYFTKRKNLKMMYGVLAALKDHAEKNKRNKVTVVD